MATASTVHCTDFLWVTDDSKPVAPATTRYTVSCARHVDEARFWRSLDDAVSAAGVFAPTAIKGHFALVSICGRTARVLTDCGGAIAVYYGSRNGRTAIGTNISEVGQALGAEVDKASVYDFIANGCVCHPYTWFSGVRVCDPASLTIIDAERAAVRSSAYWRPSEDRWMPIEEIAPILRNTMTTSLLTAIGAGPISIMFSAGEDSRVLAALTRSVEREPYIFLANKNREHDFARVAAAALGMKLNWIRVEPGHYARDLPEKQRRVGLGIDLAHAHCYGHHRIMPTNRTTVEGWGSDTFLKGAYLTQHKGRPRLGQTVTDWITQTPSPEVAERRQKRFAELHAYLPLTAYDWDRYWPLSAHRHYAHFAASRRLFPMLEPFLFSEIVQIGALIAPERKLDFSAMRLAFGGSLGLSGYLPRSEGRIPRLGHRGNLAAYPFVRLAMKIHKKLIRRGVPQGSWSGREDPVAIGEIALALRDWDNGCLSQWALAKPPVGLRLTQVQTALGYTTSSRDQETAAVPARRTRRSLWTAGGRASGVIPHPLKTA